MFGFKLENRGGGGLEVGRFHGLDSRVWFIALGEGSSVRRLMPVLWVLYYIHMLLLLVVLLKLFVSITRY